MNEPWIVQGSFFLICSLSFDYYKTKILACGCKLKYISKIKKIVEKKQNNIYNKDILNIYKTFREGSDFYENKNNRKGTKDNRSNQ